MEKGWDAKGLLQPLWERLPGKRDELARLTGISGQTLSSYNSGKRQLGYRNADKISLALGVSVLELGAPSARADDRGMTLLARLEEHEDLLDEIKRHLQLLNAGQARLQAALGVPQSEPEESPGQNVFQPNDPRPMSGGH